MHETLRLRRFVPVGTHLHVARLLFRTTSEFQLHDHDFAEVFWIERGRGTHFINGQRKRLEAGDLVLIRPPDTHAFAVRGKDGFTMVNIAFAASVLGYLHRRYFGDAPRWVWTGDELPTAVVLSPRQLDRLGEMADMLSRGALSRLELEWFLMNLLQMLAGEDAARAGASDATPPWLRHALVRFAGEPERLQGGAAELARLTGRCPEHVNRVVRKHLGKTTTDLVNDVRLDFAARQLQMTGESILNIALELCMY
jgi:AraC family cel operon transcriptional repressor